MNSDPDPVPYFDSGLAHTVREPVKCYIIMLDFIILSYIVIILPFCYSIILHFMFLSVIIIILLFVTV